jgi:hypothetical protein
MRMAVTNSDPIWILMTLSEIQRLNSISHL